MIHFATGGGEAARLLDAAKGKRPADLILRGGRVANVYSGETLPADVAVAGERIAYVGPDARRLAGDSTRVVSVRGKTLVPGFIEPHAHPWMIYNPVTFAGEILRRGTTAAVYDNLFLLQLCGREGFFRMVGDLETFPLSVFWTVRLAVQATDPREFGGFSIPQIRRMLRHPRFLATAEVARWPDVWQGKPEILRGMAEARALGKAVEGHTAGASADRIGAMTAAGLSSCHEAVTPEETLSRLRQGLYVMLRNSSLRPDLKRLAPLFRNRSLFSSRVMMTTDGTTPAFIRRSGFLEGLYRIAVRQGVRPADVLRMLTLNAATYLRQDQSLGGIAPGRLANLLVLDSLDEPSPRRVFAKGTEVARNGKITRPLPPFAWKRYGFDPIPRQARGIHPDIFGMKAGGPQATLPVIRMLNEVVSRRADMAVPVSGGRADVEDVPGLLHAAWLNRARTRIVNGLLLGFADSVEGFAASFNTGLGIVAIGKSPKEMSRAVRRVFQLGGGLVLSEKGKSLFEFRLPIGGMMSPEPFSVVARETERLTRLFKARGFRHDDLIFALYLFVGDFLPDLKLTPAGLCEVKTQRIVRPPERIG